MESYQKFVFPQQLVSEIAEHLSPTVLQFISDNRYGDFMDDFSPKGIVNLTMDHYLAKSFSRDNLIQNRINASKRRRENKAVWSKKVHKMVSDLDIDNTQHPFFFVWVNFNHNSQKDLDKLGWSGKSIDDIIAEKLKEVDDWASDSDSYLISFPALSIFSKTGKKIISALKIDTFMDIYSYLKETYQLNINSFQKIYTDTLVENPLFGETKEDLNLEEIPGTDGTLVEQLILSQDSVFNTIVSKDQVGNSPYAMQSLGPVDLNLIQYGIFNNISNSFYSDRTVIAKLREFANILYPVKYNKVYVKKAAELLLSYQDFSYRIQDLKNNIAGEAFDLFDHITIKNPANEHVTAEDPYSPDAEVIIHFGDRLYQDIIQQQIIGITQSSYSKVDSELAHLLAPVLQMQRTILTKEIPNAELEENLQLLPNIDQYMTKTFDYLFFCASVRNLSRRKKENVQRLTHALNEYVNVNLFIKSFYYKNNAFTITFYPLSSDELADIKINKKERSNEQLSMSFIVSENNINEK